MQAFLGLFNYYRRFVPAAARIVKPLTDALQGGLRPHSLLTWSSEMSAAFEAARVDVSAATLLAYPSPAAELVLVTDASGSQVGAVLQQRYAGQAWCPLGFFSQKLSPAESRYSAFDRELLAVYSSILHFRHLLEGRHFSVFSDHKPLAGALHKVADLKLIIAEFVSEIKHIAGAANWWRTTCPGHPAHRPPALHLHALHLQTLHLHALHLLALLLLSLLPQPLPAQARRQSGSRQRR
jgi:RNase H-like domain found in reverse transcriptase